MPGERLGKKKKRGPESFGGNGLADDLKGFAMYHIFAKKKDRRNSIKVFFTIKFFLC